MPKTDNKPVTLIRLADIPLDQRVRAAEQCMAQASSTAEYVELFMAALDPGDASALVAA